MEQRTKPRFARVPLLHFSEEPMIFLTLSRAAVSSIVVAMVALVGNPSARAADNDKPGANAKPADGAVEVRFADNSVLKLRLLDAKLVVNSPYGKLQIPVSEIRRVDFATRLPDDVAKEIQSAITDLASMEFAKREAASATLRKHKERAYPALLEAAKQTDKEVIRRAETLIEELRDSVPEEKLVFRKFDVVETGHSKISGSIEGVNLKAHTTQFGDVPLRLSEMRSLQALGFETEVDAATAIADPGNLNSYQNQIGKTFAFRVTGVANNNLWGTDVYTTDSSLAAAAVHCGIVKVGQTGIVRVKIVPSPPAFQASARNGVTSNNYAMYVAAYQILK
jgi:hypothetical protein